MIIAQLGVVYAQLPENTTAVTTVDNVEYIVNYDWKGNACTRGIEKEWQPVVVRDKIEYEGIEYPVTAVGTFSFNREAENGTASVILPNSIVEICERAFFRSAILEISIPGSVKKLGVRCFTESKQLSKVELNDGLEEIETCAFSYCPLLESITIPKTVKKLGVALFSGATGMRHLSVSPDNPIYDSREGCNAIIETASNELVVACENTSFIPKTVTTIGNNAFSGISSIETLTLPYSVTTLKDFAFQNCKKLSKVIIPNNVKEVSFSAFLDCDNLGSIVIEDGTEPLEMTLYNVKSSGSTNPLREIYYGRETLSGPPIEENKDRYDYNGTSEIRTLTIGPLIKEVKWNFSDSLQTVKSLIQDPTNVQVNFHDIVYQNATLIVPNGTKHLYQSAEGWKNFATILEEGETAIRGISAGSPAEIIRYSLDGRRLAAPQKGVNIIRMSDGSTRKVIVK
jgi:hypothetical protein